VLVPGPVGGAGGIRTAAADLVAAALNFTDAADRVAAVNCGHSAVGSSVAGSVQALSIERQLGWAERRLQAALKALAVLRRLRGPAVGVQVNVVGTAVVNTGNGPLAAIRG
jgi:hypothetical protein